jgi:hypothetical protein
MGYDEYLFSCLLKEFDEDCANLPYDEQFDNLARLYKEFEISPYNVRDQAAYACMERFLLDVQANQLDVDEDDLDYII